MVKVELLKDMQNGAKGTVLTVSAPRAYYWKRLGVAKLHKPKPKKEKQEETENPKSKSNDKSGTTNKGKRKSKS